MKRFINWVAIPTSLMMVLGVTTAAYSDTVQTPLQSPVVVRGSSGGPQSGSCGFVSNSPNQTVVVSQSTPLRFSVQAGGQPTLLISGGGQNQCVMADNYSGGNIEIPGVWNPGTYSVYVGDRNQQGSSFTLTITQGN